MSGEIYKRVVQEVRLCCGRPVKGQEVLEIIAAVKGV